MPNDGSFRKREKLQEEGRQKTAGFVPHFSKRPFGVGLTERLTAQMIHDVEVGGLTFDASFDSGNAARVEQISENEFALWTARDCEGSVHENGCRTWFSFSVRGAALFEGRMLAFRIYNMNSQGELYKHDMRPVHRVLPSRPGTAGTDGSWERLPLAVTYSGGKANKYLEMREKSGVDGRAYDGEFSIRFEHVITSAAEGDTLYFAFCFPESYTDVVAQLAWLDSLYDLPRALVNPPGSVVPGAFARTLTEAAALAANAGGAADNAAVASDAAVAAAGTAAGTADAAAATGAAAIAAATATAATATDAAALAVTAAATNAAAAAATAAVDAALPYLPQDGAALTTARPSHIPSGQAALKPAAVRAGNLPPYGRAALELSAAAVLLAQRLGPTTPPPRSAEIYYHRELLTRSLDGRRCVRTCTPTHTRVHAMCTARACLLATPHRACSL